MIEPISAKSSLRVLQFLKKARTENESLSEQIKIISFTEAKNERLMLIAANGYKMICSADQIDALHKASLISHNQDCCRLLPLGEKRIKRAEAVAKGAKDGAFQAQHREEIVQQVSINGSRHYVKVNINESPLHRLKSRKGPDGNTWLDDAEFHAGERLRQDFTQGRLMQKTTSNWDLGLGSSTSKSGAGGKADIADSAIDARHRMEKALDCVGPDLAGVLTDVCCFLKGLESVERERRWPPRSAKLMLRTGLALLARHYGTATRAATKGKLRTWGGEGYRPSLET
ncbi:MAG: DUF6456 domain-containing protein [Rhizobiaceae bacterium]